MSSDEKNLISLKEAAKISGYSADYIGQLIRSGKIAGQQVYCNISWMTTAEAVLDYKNNGKTVKDKNKIKDFFVNWIRKVSMQVNIFKLFFQNFRFALPLLIALLVSFALFNIYLVYFFASGYGGGSNNPQNPKDNPPPQASF